MKKLLITAALALPVISQAGIIQLDFNQTACETAVLASVGNNAAAATTACNQLNSELDSAINQDLPDTDLSGYAKGISNASSVAGSGTSDYSDKFEYFVIKPSFGLGVAADSFSAPETSAGVGFTGNLVFGINLNLLPVDKLGPVEFKKMDLFVNYFSYNLDYDMGDGAFAGDLNSFGIMARYHIFEPEEGWNEGLFQWAGLFVHTGFQTSSAKLEFSTPIELGADISTPSGQTGNVQNAQVAFSIENSITRIPVEVSTYAKVLYAFTIFGGLGFDIASGNTDIDLNSSGNLMLTSPNTANIGTLTMDESNSGEPEATNFRAFFGSQLNLPFFRLYGQMQKPLGQDSIGTNFGLKIIW